MTLYNNSYNKASMRVTKITGIFGGIEFNSGEAANV